MYNDDNRLPNSNECIYNGRKLSAAVPNIKTSKDIEAIFIGADDDDEFDSLVEKSPEEGRIKIELQMTTPDEIACPQIDLEDVLRFARKNCNGIYERVQNEVKPYKK